MKQPSLRTTAVVLLLVSALVTLGCGGAASPPDPGEVDEGLSIPFERYELANGLDVVLHQDDSDPIVAVALLYHVGSARELPGRTGFAHLFEHLLFQSSENLGEGGFINGIPALGGTFNGGTSNDSTVYYEVVPKDALERVLWMESDRLGFFINTVTEPRLENEKQIVKNEKRQGVDNNPYGHTNDVIDRALYPEGHPYSWQVIGSLQDLQAATLDDVRNFYADWYGPENVTLVLAGEFDADEAKALVEKYFGEIEGGPEPDDLPVANAVLDATASLYHEDNFAQLPALTLAWPTVEQFHPDSYALDALAQLLAGSKEAPFYKVVVEEVGLAPNVSAFNRSSEVAGKFQLSARAFAGTDLDDLQAAFDTAFARFESEGVSDDDLERIKASTETSFYNGISSVLNKAFQLAQYNTFAGDPGFITEDLERGLAVTVGDVNRVYAQYIKDRPFVATSFVPRGQAELALADAVVADVYVEPIVQGAEAPVGDLSSVPFERTPSTIDRSTPPPLGAPPVSPDRDVWQASLPNGLQVYGITHSELPLVSFSLRMKGGMWLDDPDKVGVANLVTDLLMEGTAAKTPEELEAAIDRLGATLDVSASSQYITVSGRSLARNFAATMELAQEILLQPRWDEAAFTRAKDGALASIRQASSSPGAIAGRVFNKLVYGADHVLANSTLGDEASVQSITLGDLRAYYDRAISPSVAVLHVVGDVAEADVRTAAAGLGDASVWAPKDVAFPEYPMDGAADAPAVYFVDVPGAPQSVIRTGYLAMSQTDPDYYPAVVMNHQLGGGLTGRLFQILRIQNGYTYGAGSFFGGTDVPGPFGISTSVRANVTYESAALIKEILEGYATEFSDEDLSVTKDALIRANFVNYETLGAMRNMLQNISAYGYPDDYVRQREQVVAGMTVPIVQEIAAQYADPERMIWVVVGDAATQLERLEQLGYGAPVILDREARPARRP